MDKEIVIETIDSLCGIAKDSGKSIDDYKKERLSKYNVSQMDAIITQNKVDYKNSAIPIFTPEEFFEKFDI